MNILPTSLLTALAVSASATAQAQVPVFSVNASGATPSDPAVPSTISDDDGPAIRQAFQLARAVGGPAIVEFDPGATYIVRSEDPAPGSAAGAPPALLFLSYGSSPLQSVSVVGNDATLVAGRSLNPALDLLQMPMIQLASAQDVIFSDLNFDMETLPYMAGVVTAINLTAPGSTMGTGLEFAFKDGNPNASFFSDVVEPFGDGIGLVCEPGHPGRVRVTQQADWFNLGGLTYTGTSNLYSATFTGARDVSNFQVGDQFIYAGRASSSGTFGSRVFVGDSVGVTFEDMNCYASGGFFILAGTDNNPRTNNSDLTVRRCQVTRRPGRSISTCGDGLHIWAGVRTRVEDCLFEFLIDDAINLKHNSDDFTVVDCVMRDSRGAAIRMDAGKAFEISSPGLVQDNTATDLSHSFFFHGKGDYSVGGSTGVDFIGNVQTNLNNRLDTTNIHAVGSAFGAEFAPALASTLTLGIDGSGVPSAGTGLTLEAPGPGTIWDVNRRAGGQPVGVPHNVIGTVLLHRGSRLSVAGDWLYATAGGGTRIDATPDENRCGADQFWELVPVTVVNGVSVVKIRHTLTQEFLTYPQNAGSNDAVKLGRELFGPDSRLQMWYLNRNTAW